MQGTPDMEEIMQSINPYLKEGNDIKSNRPFYNLVWEKISSWNNRPQSLTEKVKWPEKQECILIHNTDEQLGFCPACCFNNAIDLCKQSLNQSSQEDVANELKFIFYAGFTKQYRTEDLIKSIMKEYVLVRRT